MLSILRFLENLIYSALVDLVFQSFLFLTAQVVHLFNEALNKIYNFTII